MTATVSISRRRILKIGAGTIAALGVASQLTRFGRSTGHDAETRILVPNGFEVRIVACSGYRSVPGSDYVWHDRPDGGACFAHPEGGWVYVSNSEIVDGGGVGALRFDAEGRMTGSYQILAGSRMNCSGGPTPWGTWISCEEVDDGLVWECDPFSMRAPVAHPDLGLFEHESACVDPLTRYIYMTEDRKDGCLYRFIPKNTLAHGAPGLGAGRLEVARVHEGAIDWAEIPDPSARRRPLREQVNGCARFAGGEGADIHGRTLRFTTKYDNRVWGVDLDRDRIRMVRDLAGIMRDVDDLTHTPSGGYLVAEDGPQMRILYFADDETAPVTLVRIPHYLRSEITGLAFDPSGTRLYFSAQRGKDGDDRNGISFELRGDFAGLKPGLDLREHRLTHGHLQRS